MNVGKAVRQAPPIPRPSFEEEAEHAATHPRTQVQTADSRTVDDLPMATLEKIFGELSAHDLARCASCCRAWRASAMWSPLWSNICQSRWAQWSVMDWHTATRTQTFKHTDWPAAWRHRFQKEKQCSELLEHLVWPQKRQAAIRSIVALGPDILEHLEEEAHAGGPMQEGKRYWAVYAASRAQAVWCAQQMSDAPRAMQLPEYQDQIEIGALLVAQLHAPFADLTPIPRFLDRLAEELRRRMEQDGVSGGLEAVKLLSDLLFGQPGPGTASNGSTLSLPSLSGSVLEEALNLPAPGYGMGLQGDSEGYYSPENSLLQHVLTAGKGIPISLAIVHAAVGRRAGLDISCVNMPRHFINRYGSFGDAEERFIDAFDGGKLLTRSAALGMLRTFTGAARQEDLAPAPPDRVWYRCCYNLISLYHNISSFPILRSILNLALAVSPADASGTYSKISADLRMLRAQIATDLDDYSSALDDIREVKASGIPADTDLDKLAVNVQSIEAKVLADWNRQRRRGDDESSLRYCVGEIMKHRKFGYEGLIAGWDPKCLQSKEWISAMGVDKLPGGRDQPFYHVLVDKRDRADVSTYVAECNIELRHYPSATPPNSRRRARGNHHHPLGIQHEKVAEYFDGIAEGASAYRRNAFLQWQYPDD